jgi:hypothetical protein
MLSSSSAASGAKNSTLYSIDFGMFGFKLTTIFLS